MEDYAVKPMSLSRTEAAMNRGHDVRSSIKLAARLYFGLALAFALIGATSSEAQTFTVLHAFAGGTQGGYPQSQAVALDSHGNLYGAANIAFKLAAGRSG